MNDPVRAWQEHDGALLRIRLNRPKANILDADMISALDRELDRLAGLSDLHAILLDAEGPHFSFGASVEEHLPQQCADMLRGFHELLLKMLSTPVPILVAVRGQCLGGGLELACAGTLIFAAPEATLGQPEIVLGLIAPAASCLLPLRLGLGHAEDLLLSGRSVDAGEALRMGLVHSLGDDPENLALNYFREHLQRKSASSLRVALQASRKGMIGEIKSKLAAVEELYLNKLMKTRDAIEGLNAFLEKRPPKWEDR